MTFTIRIEKKTTLDFNKKHLKKYIAISNNLQIDMQTPRSLFFARCFYSKRTLPSLKCDPEVNGSYNRLVPGSIEEHSL